MPLDQSIRIVLALSVAAATLMGFSVSASARYRSAIAAGVAGGVAGTIAGEALSGAMRRRLAITPQPIHRQRRAAGGNTARSSTPTRSTLGRCKSATDGTGRRCPA